MFLPKVSFERSGFNVRMMHEDCATENEEEFLVCICGKCI